jgi:hypothetical protein
VTLVKRARQEHALLFSGFLGLRPLVGSACCAVI